MANLFGGVPKTAAKTATKAMGIQLQGSQYGPSIPVVYGRNKVAGNCVWYGDFRAVKHQQKVGKGGGATSTSYTYSASFQLGLCEGQIGDVRTIYSGTSTVSATQIGAVIATGSTGQAAWSHLSSPFNLGYSHTALLSVQNLSLGSSPTLPNYNFEVDALQQYSGTIPDANPKDILTDICTNTEHGIGFNLLGDLTQYSDYCVANSLFLSPVYSSQQSANQALGDLFKWTNTYPYFSEGKLKVAPLGDQAVTGNSVTFTPDVTPVVDLGADDLLVMNPGDPPVSVDRTASADALNLIRVEFTDRSQSYHTSGVVAQMDDDVIDNGSRSDQTVQVDACTTGSVARFIAQNMLQRAFYVRNTYTFRVGWRYCYLEPTDIVTLTDAATDLSSYPVRITQVEEDEEGTLTLTAEEFPEGIGHAASYAYETPSGTLIDTNADPGAVNSPFLFRGPGFLVNGANPEIWCAVNGSGTYWAGCEVHLSYDGSSYQYLGTYTGGARYGYLTTTLPTGSDPDTSHTPAVQLQAPGTLLGGSVTDADNFNTLAIVDTEVVSYETATLAAANKYTLGYLRRGGYGSAIAAHAVNAPFARLDDDIIRIPVDPSLIGTTVYLKFLSINSFGRTPRDLASETAYTYVVGSNVELPDVPAVPGSPAATSVADGVSITWTNANPAAIGATSIEYATASTGPWTVLAQVGPTANSYAHHFTSGATFYYRLRARGALVQSGWSAYTATVTNKAKTVADGATAGADWPTNVTSRPTELTDGRVATGLNAAGALQTKFANPKLIAGVSFDGSADITIPISNIPDDSSFRKVGASYVDSSNRLHSVYDSTLGGLRTGAYLGTGAARATSGLDSAGAVAKDVPHGFVRYADGTGIESLKPGEAGAVKNYQSLAYAPQNLHNLIKKPNFQDNDLGPSWASSNSSAVAVGSHTSATYAMQLAGSVYDSLGWFDVVPGEVYRLEYDATAFPAPTSGSCTPYLHSQKPDGTNVFTGGPSGYGGDIDYTGNGSGTNWIYGLKALITIPAGVYHARWLFNVSGADATHGYRVTNIKCYRAQASDAGSGIKAYADFTDNTSGGHVGKVIDNMADGTHAKILASELDAGVHKLGVAGSGYQLGDPRQMQASQAVGLGSALNTTTSVLTGHSDGSVDIASHNIQIGTHNTSYSAQTGAITGLSVNPTVGSHYDIYTRDNFAGGSPVFYAIAGNSTPANRQTINGYGDAYYPGVAYLPASGSSGGSGNPKLN